MKKNIGTFDSVIRFVVAAVLVLLIYLETITGTIAVVAGIAASAFVITGIIGWCGLYALLGIRTCATSRNQHT